MVKVVSVFLKMTPWSLTQFCEASESNRNTLKTVHVAGIAYTQPVTTGLLSETFGDQLFLYYTCLDHVLICSLKATRYHFLQYYEKHITYTYVFY